MSTLQEMRENLEQLEQDGARFRWIASSSYLTLTVLETALYGTAQATRDERLRMLREHIDRERCQPPNTVLDAPGGRAE